ncbi:hypothetical protein [Streptomyces coeruleoprunus]|uniref:hypothetical protein n=1 Tax=Streptomyces coeruleoprunus TaxID=285563 RepID=UPI0031EFB2FA
MVEPWSPLRFRPETTSYAVMPAMAVTNTSAAAATDRFQPRTRLRYVVASPNVPSGCGGCAGAGEVRAAAPWNRSPVLAKRYWKTDPPQVAMTLITPAPRTVP